MLLFSLGLITSLSLPPYNFFLINFFTFSLFFIFLFKKKQNKDNRKSFLYGWFFGFGFFISNLYWITISLTFDENFKFLIPLAFVLIPAALAIFYGLVSYFFFLFKTKKLINNFLLFSLLFGIIEFLRGNILTGFPWNLIAYSFSHNIEIIQIVSSIGTYAFNLLCISIFSSPAIFILRKSKKEIAVCVFFLLSPFILYFFGSSKIKSFQSLKIIENDFVIRAIGSKIDLERFYGNSDTISVIEELVKISNPDPELKIVFLWPEGIIPNINRSEIKEFKYLFNKNFNENHLLAIGINNFDNNKFYNTLSIFDNNLNLINEYNKINLVPFGEFLPFEKIFGKFGLKSLTNNYQSFTGGEKRKLILIDDNDLNIRILPLICYEIIYSGKIFDNYNFDYIINISEDGWFGDSIGPHQHFSHAIFRAIESGKYLIRSANNGISAIINPVGSIEKIISFGKSGYIDFSEKRVLNITLFSHYGNKMFLMIILLYISLLISFNRISE